MKQTWDGKHVLIIGAARQGLASARFLSLQGAEVTLNDHRSANDLQKEMEFLNEFPINWITGSHPLEVLNNTDVVCLSGGVPLDLPIIKEAAGRGIPLVNDTQLFMEIVPCKTVGITGSAGKTTTTALLGRIAKNYFSDKTGSVWVGGNIGDPLLNHIEQIQPNDLAILEISSFQLEQMTLSPDLAIILNITPNHLDRHKTMEAYISAKERIIAFQGKDSTAILGRDDPICWSLKDKVRGKLLSFGFSPMRDIDNGIEMHDEKLFYRIGADSQEILDMSNIKLLGDHNKLNIMAACLAAVEIGVDTKRIQTVIEEFQGVSHRLEFVRTWKNSSWYDDSIATTPERTLAAIRSFDEPLVLLLGGRDKNLPWKDLVDTIQNRVRLVVLFGEAAEMINKALLAIPDDSRNFAIQKCKSLHEAVLMTSDLIIDGDVVLLSPGGTSFDEFRDFEERGERFKQWVQELS